MSEEIIRGMTRKEYNREYQFNRYKYDLNYKKKIQTYNKNMYVKCKSNVKEINGNISISHIPKKIFWE